MTKTYKRKYRKTLGKPKKGGETPRKSREAREAREARDLREVNECKKRKIAHNRSIAIRNGLYLSPNGIGPIVNQNLDILELNQRYNDEMDHECAEKDGLTFGGKRRRKNKKNKTLRKKH